MTDGRRRIIIELLRVEVHHIFGETLGRRQNINGEEKTNKARKRKKVVSLKAI